MSTDTTEPENTTPEPPVESPVEPAPPATPVAAPESKPISPEVGITQVHNEEKAPPDAKPSPADPASPSSPFVPTNDADMGEAMSKLKKKLAPPSPETRMEHILASKAAKGEAVEEENQVAPQSEDAHKINAGRGQEILKTITSRQPPSSPSPTTGEGGGDAPAPASPIKWQGWDEEGAMSCERLTNDAEELACQRRLSGQPAVYGGMCSVLNKKGEWEEKFLSVSDNKLWSASYFSVPPLSILSRPKVEAGPSRNRTGQFSSVVDLASSGLLVNFQAAPGTSTGFMLVLKPMRGDAVKLAPKRFQALLEWGAVFSQALTEAPAGTIQDRVALLKAKTRATMFGVLDPQAAASRSALDSITRVSRPLVDSGLFTQATPVPPVAPAAPTAARGAWIKDHKDRRRARSQGRPSAAKLEVPKFATAVVHRRGRTAAVPGA